MAVLYLVEQGASLHKDSDVLSVTKDSTVLQRIPAAKVEQVVIFGNINITTPVIHYLLEQGIDCVFCSSTGRYHGRLLSTESKYGLLRQSQLKATQNTAMRTTIARLIVKGKLANQRTMLMRYAREEPSAPLDGPIEAIHKSMENAEKAPDIGSLLGIEGYAGNVYYGALKLVIKQDLGFQCRVRRPPRDPVNSLLSFGYTLLTYAAQAAVRVVGLDPFIGFLHSTEYSKPSLALDIMEEFRPLIVDSVVLRVLNNNILTAASFEPSTERSGMVKLRPEAVKTFLHHYEERIQTSIQHPLTGEQVDYRRCLELQARQLARIITGQQSVYQPFITR
ncbi:MAG: CRISPR-associated endonuclease Cas1 [Chloroflexota bacterium]